MIVAFEGSYSRVRMAYRLADQAYAPTLVISPASASRLSQYDHSYRPTRRFNKIIEDKARTTFENALYTRKIIKQNGFKTVNLVTSWNHMPRAYLLLKLLLAGSGTRVKPNSVATGKLDQENWFRTIIGWKMIYNEILKTWGSLFEMAQYGLDGQVSITEPGKTNLFIGLKKILLLKIDPLVLSVKPS